MQISRLFSEMATSGDTGGLIPPIGSNLSITARIYNGLPVTMPGCDIGSYTIADAANRMLAQGVTPRYAAVTYVIDMDTSVNDVAAVVASARLAAVQAEVEIADADYSVVSDGPATGIDVSVVMVGEVPPGVSLGSKCVKASDTVLITGPVGAYGMALAEHRKDAVFLPPVGFTPVSLGDMVRALTGVNDSLRYMYYISGESFRSALAAMEKAMSRNVTLDTDAVPVGASVLDACRTLDVDPLTVPTSGVLMAVVDSAQAEQALDAVKRSAYGAEAAVIGHVI
ncbi:MAG: AIR synthase-related protein [Muribaculaceae bacterium]|nr:AIR synthase-related protein [Muribaculaceae bacterium]